MILSMLVALQIKHFLADWVFQTKEETVKKGIYGHVDGAIHAGKNAFLTALVFGAFGFWLITPLIFAIDFLLHYHIDYGKVQINDYFKLTPENKMFWVLMGADQMLHQLTYILLIFMFV